MWKPGQLVTLNGVVYRIKRVDHNSKALPCESCIFEEWSFSCNLPKYKGIYRCCIDLIPSDCHFEKVSPSPRGQF